MTADPQLWSAVQLPSLATWTTISPCSARLAYRLRWATRPEVKRQANHVTASNTDDGFDLAIERFILNWQ
jgi:hypothetical protein